MAFILVSPGTIWNTVFKGAEVAELLKLMPPVAMTLGNHEFDFGTQVLSNFVDKIDFPVISCNIDTSKVPELQNKYKKSHMFELDNRMKVKFTRPKFHPPLNYGLFGHFSTSSSLAIIIIRQGLSLTNEVQGGGNTA